MLILKLVIISVLSLVITNLSSQTIITIPLYPQVIDSCTIIFDATKGNGELANIPPPIYAHTGVITNMSTSGSDWKYVIAGWGDNTAKALMTPLGNNRYQLKLLPDIRTFYNVPVDEEILKLAFVFRNSDGSKVGRESNGGDIFCDVYSSGLSVNITSPATNDIILLEGQTLSVAAISPLADSMFLFVNDILIKQVAGNTISEIVPASGEKWVLQTILITAENDTAIASDSVIFRVVPQPQIAELPTGIIEGINYIDSTTVILSLFAPYKQFCFVTGDFNDWQIDSNHYMKRNPQSNRFWVEIGNLVPHHEYIFQYVVNGTLRIADPYTQKVSDPEDQYIPVSTYPGLLPYPALEAKGIASVLQTAQDSFQWNTTNFTPPKTTDLVIYELLLRDFLTNHDYQTLEDTLSYFKKLGINAIELMPVMEFEGNQSWGYNPDFMFAPDKYYGPENSLKHFIDKAHSMGIAIILDIVVNHQFGQSPLVRLYWDDQNNRPSSNSPYFNVIPKHPYNVGYDFNHASIDTRRYFERVFRYWIENYHIDGYRFDLSKGLTQVNSYPDNVGYWSQYDVGRISILKSYSDTIRSIKSDFILIMEHFAENNEEKELSEYGMLLWGNLNWAYSQAAKGNTGASDFSSISYKNRLWNLPHLIGYMESHDEERTMVRTINEGNSYDWYDTRELGIALARHEMNAAFFYTIPGPKMLWEFGELGYDYSINYGGGRLSPKPPRWDYMDEWKRKRLFNTVSSLIELRKTEDAFETSDFTVNASGAMKKIHLNHSTMNVTIAGNFDVVSGNIAPQFQNSGMWYDYFSGDSLYISDPAQNFVYNPGEYHIYTTKKLQRPTFVGIENQTNTTHGVYIYPNPAGDYINVFSEEKLSRIEVYDLTGRLLLISMNNFDHLDISTCKAGIYYLRVFTVNNETSIFKVVKK